MRICRQGTDDLGFMVLLALMHLESSWSSMSSFILQFAFIIRHDHAKSETGALSDPSLSLSSSQKTCYGTHFHDLCRQR